ncbi:MAG: hypothetical protein HQM06_02310 [Magnetococcales bacterium]|nr:hypothetical protein [Magnetococcales bacterium]
MTSSPTAIILTFLRQQQGTANFSAPQPDDNLFELALLTSLQFIELIQLLESKTGISIDFTRTDPSSLVTLQGLSAAFGSAAPSTLNT